MAQSQVSRDVNKRVTVTGSLFPQSITAATTGSQVDLVGQGDAYIALSVGTVTDGTYTVVVQESNTSGSGFTTVAAASLSGAFTTFTTTSGSQTQTVGYLGNNRYLKVAVPLTTSASTGAVVGANVVACRPRVI